MCAEKDEAKTKVDRLVTAIDRLIEAIDRLDQGLGLQPSRTWDTTNGTGLQET